MLRKKDSLLSEKGTDRVCISPHQSTFHHFLYVLSLSNKEFKWFFANQTNPNCLRKESK